MKDATMKITHHSANLVSLIHACDSADGTTTDIHTAFAEKRSEMWFLYPKAGVEYSYVSAFLDRCVQSWQTDLENHRAPWE
jgi:hypothetical protein